MNILFWRTPGISKHATTWADAHREGKDTAGFDRWVRKSPGRVGEFLVLSVLPSLTRESQVLKEYDRNKLAEEAQTHARRIARKKRAAIASCVLLPLAAIAVLFYNQTRDWVEYSTVGRPAWTVILTDGSEVQLSTDTVVNARTTLTSRDMRFITGDALFDVEKEKLWRRTFRVTVRDDATIVVKGTRFSVRDDDAGSTIDVLEGVVEVSSAKAEVTARTLKQGESLVVLDGGSFQEKAVEPPAPVTATSAPVRVRAGQRPGPTVGSIADRWNRNNGRPRILVDPDARDLPLWDGTIRSREEFIRVLRQQPQLRVTGDDDQLVIKRARR